VSALGGVEYISALKKPFPHIPMVASQGVQIGTDLKSNIYHIVAATSVSLGEFIE